MASEGSGGAEQHTDGEERGRRLAALTALAREQGASGPESVASERRPSTRRSVAWQRWMLVASVALAVIVVATVVSGYLLTKAPKESGKAKTPPALTSFKIDLTNFALYCPQALAWSPDGSQFAVLASSTTCMGPNVSYWPDTIAIFDTANGEEYRYFTFSSVLPHGAHIDRPALTWSPDGKFLATVAQDGGGPDSPQTDILVTASLDSNAIMSSGMTESSDGALFGTASDEYIWHIEAQQMGAQRQISYPIPAAASYSIDATGHLVPDQAPLPGLGTLMGSPVATGAGRYSLWENGVIVEVDNYDHGMPSSPTLYYTASVPMWSADGAYLAPSVGLGAYPLPVDSPQAIASNGTDTCSVHELPPCAAKPIPYPDKAFQRTIEAILTNPRFSSFTTALPVAWRPDGKLMATILPGDFPTFQSGQFRVSVLRTDTGATAQTFTALTNVTSAMLNAQASLDWSPNGRQLSFVDYGGSSVSVWAVAS